MLRILGILAWAIFCINISLPVFAFTKDAVKCVQEQLNEAGFNAGLVDGSVGPNSRRAMAAFEKEHGTVSKRPFSRSTALVYCRLVGLQFPELQKHWLSNEKSLKIFIDPDFVFHDVDEAAPIHRFRSSLTFMDMMMRRRLDLALAAPVTVIVANSADQAIAMQKKHSKLRPKSPISFVRSQCDNNYIGGYAVIDLIVLCRNGSALPDVKNLDKIMREAVAHELFHAYQFQLTGKTSTTSQAAFNKLNGPLWMTEGTASFVGIMMVYSPQLSKFEEVSIKRIFRNRKTMVGLNQLKTMKSRKKYGGALYHIGTLAVTEALDVPDIKKLIEFYDRLGQEGDWVEAFKLTFDEPFEEFETRFKSRFMQMTRENPTPKVITSQSTN